MRPADPEVEQWAHQCLLGVESATHPPAHELNIAHLRLRLSDPVFADSEAGRRAVRTIENLQAQLGRVP